MSRRLLAFNSGDRQAARFDTLASELYGEAAGRFRTARSLPASWRLFMVVEDDRPLARAAAISSMKSGNFSGSRKKKTGVLLPTRSQLPSSV